MDINPPSLTGISFFVPRTALSAIRVFSAACACIVATGESWGDPYGADYVMKHCLEVEHASGFHEVSAGNANVLRPQVALARLLKLKDDALDPLVRLDTMPEHGQLRRIAYTTREQLPGGQTSWATVYANPDGSMPMPPLDTDKAKYFKPAGEEYDYLTTPGFYGNDRAAFSVEYKRKRYRIDLEIRVYDFVPQTSEGISCAAPRLIEVVPKR
jgi:hypothetical protein